MLAYLINLSIIWTLSLLLYELLFKHQTFHKLNRIYLLVTLIMGVALPLFSAPERPKQNIPSTFQYSLYRVANAKQDFIQTSTIKAAKTAAFNFPFANLLAWVYVAGCIVALMLLFRELRIIRRYYKKGVKHKSGKWIIVETNQSHGPFSLLHYIFVSDSRQYNEAEWRIVLTHEKAHGQLFHFFDLTLLQLLRICCWFHPLVYVYRKYILLLHEYQADQCSAPEPAAYGRFLIAQSMLQHAPSFSHSLNRFSLKNRITMLTRSSSGKMHALKLVLIIPLIAVCFVCCTKQNAGKTVNPSNKNNDTVIQLAHDRLTLHIVKIDSLYMDNKGKKVAIPFHMDPIPYKLNGEMILQKDDGTTTPHYIGPDQTIIRYLLNNLEEELQELPDGRYTATGFGGILNKTGQIVYCYRLLVHTYSPTVHIKHTEDFYATIFENHNDKKQYEVSEALQNQINQKVKELVEYKTLFTPATKNGATVPYQLVFDDPGFTVNFYMKNGTIQF